MREANRLEVPSVVQDAIGALRKAAFSDMLESRAYSSPPPGAAVPHGLRGTCSTGALACVFVQLPTAGGGGATCGFAEHVALAPSPMFSYGSDYFVRLHQLSKKAAADAHY